MVISFGWKDVKRLIRNHDKISWRVKREFKYQGPLNIKVRDFNLLEKKSFFVYHF